MRSSGCGIVAGLAGLALAAGSASATWSIVIVDTRTGEVAAGSATCLTNINLKDETPVVILGRGAATAQALLEQTGVTRSDLRQGILLGQDPDVILATLANNDSGHQTRQYGMVDVQGRAMTFSGNGANDWKGGVTGRLERGAPGPADDIVYAIQGNILTGAGVVLAAEAAIQASPGDLADMLMEGMQAARITGGDGRCSCLTGGPTSCGTPPSDDPNDFKSADVGYMIVGRAGDRDESRALYRFFESSDLLGLDLDNDGREELLAFNAAIGTTRAYGYLEASVPGAIAVERLNDLSLPIGGVRQALAGDVTGDGVDDLLVVRSVGGGLQLVPGPIDTATAALDYEGLGSIVGLEMLDLDGLGGQDVVVLNGGSVRVLRGGSASELSEGPMVDLSIQAEGLRLGDLDGDGRTDLAVFNSAGQIQLLYNAGDGQLTPGPVIELNETLLDMAAVDVDGDGASEFVTLRDGSNDTHVVGRDGTAGPSLRTGFSPSRLIQGEFVSDVAGEFVVVSNRRTTTVAPDGAGGLLELSFETMGQTLLEAEPIDLSGDGLQELASPVETAPGSPVLLLLVENRDGAFSEPRGWGAGRYWMTLNVANTARSDPDPVVTLQERFDRWRTNRAGLVDAVYSEIVGGGVIAPTSTATYEVDLQAYPGVPITSDPLVTASTDDDSVARVVNVEQIDGKFVITVEGVAEGTAALRVVADDGGFAPVELMPAPEVRVRTNPADFNGDGVQDNDDFFDFVQAFVSGDLAADYNGDGVLDRGDIARLLSWL